MKKRYNFEKNRSFISKGKIFAKTAALSIIFFCLIFLWAASSFPSYESAAQKMGQINILIQEIFHKVDHPREKSATEGHINKCATPIIQFALKNKELLQPENHFILYRPTNVGDQDYYGNVEVLYFDRGHFRVHYTEDNRYGDAVPGSDGNPNTIPYYILNLASYLEYSWKKEIVTMGYQIKNFDGLIGGGSNLIDVYVLDISYYGYTSIENNYPYIVIDKDLGGRSSSVDDDPNGVLKVTAAHEFFHVIQYDYDNWDNLWWEENTAVWMEDEVYDHVNDYIRYLPYKLDNLDLPLDEEPYYSELFIYGGVIWAKFLSETHGQVIIRDIFERCRDINPPLAKQAIGYILENFFGSNWTDAMTQFCVKNLTRDYEEVREGFDYPQVSLTKSITTTEIENAFFSQLWTLEHLSCQYFKLQSGQEAKKLYVSLTKYGTPPIGIFVGDRSRTGIPVKESADIYYPDTNLVLDGFGTSSIYPQAYLIVLNPDPTSDSSYYSWAAAFDPNQPPPDPPLDPNQSAFLKSDGGGCFISSLPKKSFF